MPKLLLLVPVSLNYRRLNITCTGFCRSMDWQADQLLSSTSLQDERS